MTTTAASEKQNERARKRRRRKLLRRCLFTCLLPNTCTSTAAWFAVSALASVPYFGGVPSSIAARCHLSICPGLSLSIRHWRPRWFTKAAQEYHRYPPQCPTFSTLNKISCTSWSRCKVTSKQPNANYQRWHKSGGRSYYLLSTGTRSSKR